MDSIRPRSNPQAIEALDLPSHRDRDANVKVASYLRTYRGMRAQARAMGKPAALRVLRIRLRELERWTATATRVQTSDAPVVRAPRTAARARSRRSRRTSSSTSSTSSGASDGEPPAPAPRPIAQSGAITLDRLPMPERARRGGRRDAGLSTDALHSCSPDVDLIHPLADDLSIAGPAQLRLDGGHHGR